MKWHNFNQAKTRGRWLPKERQLVLVQCVPNRQLDAPPVAVGYLRFAAGDKQSPFFVVPGVPHAAVIAWCDCLPVEFNAPLWDIPDSRKTVKK